MKSKYTLVFGRCGITPDSRVFNFNTMEEIVCKRCGSLEHIIKELPPHRQAICKHCGNYIKNIQQDNPVIWFGKYNGLKLSEFNTKDHCDWLRWALEKATVLKEHHKVLIRKHLGL